MSVLDQLGCDLCVFTFAPFVFIKPFNTEDAKGGHKDRGERLGFHSDNSSEPAHLFASSASWRGTSSYVYERTSNVRARWDAGLGHLDLRKVATFPRVDKILSELSGSRPQRLTMLGESIGRGAMRIINAMVRGLASLGVHPNLLTAIGVTINIGCGVLFGIGEFFWAGVVLIVANVFDMLDGNVARLTGRVTKFGSFLDSSLDRLSDMVVFVGIMAFYAGNRPQHSILNVVLAGVALMASVMVSYTTARSEGLGVKANVGFLQRPERVVLLIIGALSTWDWNSDSFWFNRMPQVLWVLAVGSVWTLIHRMFYIWKEFRKLEEAN